MINFPHNRNCVFYQNSVIDTSQLIHKYFSLIPDPTNSTQRIKFGTSGHRGNSIDCTFNESHVLAITQAIVKCRKKYKINGPCYLGKDTRVLSEVAFISVLEILSANRVDVFIEEPDRYTPSPVISHAILKYNKNLNNDNMRADGIIVTSSHNPPEDGGIKYYSCYAGSADTNITEDIEKYSNMFLENNLRNIRRLTLKQAWGSGYIHIIDFTHDYIKELTTIVNMKSIQQSGLKLCIDLMGGAGTNCWHRIAQFYELKDVIFINDVVDPTFQFLYSNCIGVFHLDCSFRVIITNNILNMYNRFDLILSNDPDCDRYGIATSTGFLESNDYLIIAINYLFQNRPNWNKKLCVGKTIVSSSTIDNIVKNLHLCLIEVPIGFKWFVKNLFFSVLGFAGEESAGGIFLDYNARPWSTDKDGIIMCLLAAEISSVTNRTLHELYSDLIKNIDLLNYNRIQIPTNYYSNNERLFNFFISKQIEYNELAGDPIKQKIKIMGNQRGTNLNGIKLVTNHGWIAFRVSGTEKIYKIYSESSLGTSHREDIESEICENFSDCVKKMT